MRADHRLLLQHHQPPLVAARLRDLPPGSRLLDIGAGVTPVPLWLANRGMLVDCVDPHPVIRTLPAADDWNEWGFFDYSVVDARIQSYHRDAREHVPTQRYDRIYSVSALAHMTYGHTAFGRVLVGSV